MSGFTLVEVMATMVIASLLSLGIMVLYFAAQRTWLESSSKLLLQQNSTLLLSTIGNPIRSSHDFTYAAGDSSAVTLQRCGAGHTAISHQDFARIYWSSSDSLVKMDRLVSPVQSGIVLSNLKVTRLRFAGVPHVSNKLRVSSMRARDTYGQTIDLTSEFVMQNFTFAPAAP